MTRFGTTIRLVSAVAAAAMAVALFAACKSPNTTSSAESSSEETTSIENIEQLDLYDVDPNIPQQKDLGGFEMTYAITRPKAIIPEAGESPEGDIILDALRKTQEAYNCVIMVKELGEGDWDSVTAAITSGEQYANVLMPRIHQAGAIIQSRLCADYLRPEIAQYIDMNEPWWNITMAYASNLLGSVYAGAPAIDGPADRTFVTFFNKRIASEIGATENELYDLWENKQWNWDAMIKYGQRAMKDKDGNGVVDTEDDQWGLVGPGYDSTCAFLSSANIIQITHNNGQDPRYNLDSPHAISAITKLNGIYTTDNIFFPASAASDMTFLRTFVKGNALFLAYRLDTLMSTDLRDMEDDFGVLTMPLGPGDDDTGWQEKYMSRVDHNFCVSLIPSTVEDFASTALVLESMAFNYWKITLDKVDTYASLYCRDDRSVDVANTVYNTTCFDMAQFFWSINSNAWHFAVNAALITNYAQPNFDVSAALTSVADVAQQIIDDYFNGIS